MRICGRTKKASYIYREWTGAPSVCNTVVLLAYRHARKTTLSFSSAGLRIPPLYPEMNSAETTSRTLELGVSAGICRGPARLLCPNFRLQLRSPENSQGGERGERLQGLFLSSISRGRH